MLYSRNLFIIIVLLFAACGGCSDPVNESDLFKPQNYGEYKFDGAPDLVAPKRLLFGDIEVGATGVKSATIKNVGNELLKFSDWKISEHFSMRFLGVDGKLSELEAGQSAELIVSHQGFSSEKVAGKIVIDSNDPDSPQWEIELYVNARFPCLELVPEEVLDFGEVETEMTSRRPINVRNCSPNTETTFSVGNIQGSSAFRVPDRDQFQDIRLEPGASIQIFVDFQPDQIGNFEAKLDFQSDDAFEPTKWVDLKGIGAAGRCPQAVIVATHPDRKSAKANPTGTFDGLPLDTVLFDALESRGFDGRHIEKYEWAVTSRPTDSAALLANTNSKNTQMFLDLTGEYTLELQVWDSEGIRSCEPARLKIRAIAAEDIHIQLVWNTPNDPDQLDSTGSDLDVHLLHPRGQWNERPYDCFWQNLNPDWASQRPGASDFCNSPSSPGCQDDPSLDIDDVDGWGPENINLDNPQDGIRYGVGVHYFSDHGYGVSRATIRIYIGGLLEREFLRQALTDEQFWYVGDIEWPSGKVSANGGVFNGFPSK